MERLVEWQSWIHASVAAQLTAFAATHDWAGLAAVLPLGIVFGAIHALTPGHGKSVLASYLVGSETAFVRGIGVAGILAVTHVLSAVVLALAVTPLITRGLGGAGQSPVLETVSRGLIVAIGVWLLVRVWRGQRHLHGEGPVFGFVAGLVPCPLSLFVMVMALARGVPEAGLVFVAGMMAGVALTLAAVAALTLLARGAVVSLMNRYGASIDRLSRGLDMLAGLLLIVIGMAELRT
jgi:nickel/cobalt exporter